jgi:hypothetical protein
MNDKWKAMLKGAKRSWTIISASAVAVVGALQTQIDALRKVFVDNTEVVLISLAVVMALLRVRTDSSLADKGKDGPQG